MIDVAIIIGNTRTGRKGEASDDSAAGRHGCKSIVVFTPIQFENAPTVA
jgi:hypothetical protein